MGIRLAVTQRKAFRAEVDLFFISPKLTLCPLGKKHVSDIFYDKSHFVHDEL